MHRRFVWLLPMSVTQHEACNDMVLIRPQTHAMANEVKEGGMLMPKEKAK